MGTRPEVARAYAVSKLGWIRDQQAKLRGQARETPRQFVERESHYLWGRRYLLSVKDEEAKPPFRLARFEFRFPDLLGPPTAHLKRGRQLLQSDIPRLVGG